MSKYHVSNFGIYSKTMPQDLDGYTYTTKEGWLSARMDSGTLTEDQAIDYADYACESIEAAEMALASFNRQRRG